MARPKKQRDHVAIGEELSKQMQKIKERLENQEKLKEEKQRLQKERYFGNNK